MSLGGSVFDEAVRSGAGGLLTVSSTGLIPSSSSRRREVYNDAGSGPVPTGSGVQSGVASRTD